jgi:hypothetical protein
MPVVLFLTLSGCNNTPGNIKSKAQGEKPLLNSPNETVMRSADTTATSSLASSPEQDKLMGRWLRTDGNYIIEVFEAAPDGILRAGYYNPGTINVEKGEWIIQDDTLYMRIILRDINYPGSTYILQYSAENDALVGNYFQAVEGINYDVFFTRKK